MLLFPEDAEDATQEILVKVVTHLSTFRGESRFTTWVYRIATNYLITTKGQKANTFARSFSDYETLIDTGHSEHVLQAQNEGELALLEEEVKISCTHGLLLCLNTTSRMVYILGEILEFSSKEGAAILDISPANFRQQLSRSRNLIRNFLQQKCGLVNPENPCRCRKKIDFLTQQAIVNPHQLRFAPFSQRSIEWIDKISQLEKSTAIYRSVPNFPTPQSIIENMKETIALL